MLKVIVIVPETSLLVLFGYGLGWVLGWVAGTNFSFVMGWVRLRQTVGGLDWAGSKKMDPRTTLELNTIIVSARSPTARYRADALSFPSIVYAFGLDTHMP